MFMKLIQAARDYCHCTGNCLMEEIHEDSNGVQWSTLWNSASSLGRVVIKTEEVDEFVKGRTEVHGRHAQPITAHYTLHPAIRQAIQETDAARNAEVIP